MQVVMSKNIIKDQEIHRLCAWEEAAGRLQSVDIDGRLVILSFRSGMKISLVGPEQDLVKKLENAIGETVNVLRTDITDKEYCIKIFNDIKKNIDGSTSIKIQPADFKAAPRTTNGQKTKNIAQLFLTDNAQKIILFEGEK